MAEAVPPDDVSELKEQVAQLRAKLDRRATWGARLRGAALVFLLVVGCGLVAMSVIAAYVRLTVLDTDRYVAAMAPIARSPDVQSAVAGKLDAAIASRVDFDGLMRAALPEKTDPFAPALASGLRNAITSRIDSFVASDEFARLWDDANRRIHARVVALLTTGESGRVKLEDDTVFLDLSPAVDRVRDDLERRGLGRLAAAIPSDVDGRVTLLQSEGFVKARDGVDLLERLTILLPILALLCLAGHVALSRPRRRGLLRVGLGLIATALLLLALVGVGRSAYLDAIDREVLPREAAADIFDSLIELLRAGLRGVAVAAVVLSLLALVLGRAGGLVTRSRTALRGLSADPRIGWVAQHRAVLQGAILGLGALVLFSWDPPTASVVLIDAVLVAAALALVAAVAGGARRPAG